MFANRAITLGSPTGEIVSLATLKTYLGISGSGDDTILTLMLAAATQTAEDYCARFFLQRTVAEVMTDELPSRRLVLSRLPVGAFTSLVDSDGVTVSASDYSVDLASGLLTHDDPGFLFEGDLTATYTAGWLAANVPASIQLAILEIAKQNWNAKTRDPDVVIRQSPDIGMVTYRGAVPGVTASSKSLADMPASAQRYLSAYKRGFA